LDVTFKEDAGEVKVGYAPENLSILRKFAIYQQKDRLSLKKRYTRPHSILDI
jgi:hypothetical protein